MLLLQTKEVLSVAFSYKPLWKLLIDKELSKKELMRETGISKSTMDKMGRGQPVSMDIIERLCSHFHCQIEDVVEHVESYEAGDRK